MPRQFDLDCGAPRKVCVWDCYYLLFMHRISLKLLKNISSTAHCFADDIQLYLSFKPGDAASQNDAISAMNKSIDDLRNGMIKDRLMINDNKTEILLR